MADAAALDAALLPIIESLDEYILDGYPRTMQQRRALPAGVRVVGLNIDPLSALQRIAGRSKHGWDEDLRMEEQAALLKPVMGQADQIVNVQGKTVGEIVFEIITATADRRKRPL